MNRFHFHIMVSAALCLSPSHETQANEKADNFSDIRKAVARANIEEIQDYIKRGADIRKTDSNGNTLLHSAPSSEIALLLIENGLDLNAENNVGWTPLHYAAVRGKTNLVATLLDKGAETDAQTAKQKKTAMHMVSERNRLAVARLLLENGADLKKQDEAGWTPLHYAAEKGHIDMVRLLLEKGADVNAVSHGGGTPLHEASVAASAELIELLIKNGADVNIKTKKGVTALQFATEFKNREVMETLKKHGAEK